MEPNGMSVCGSPYSYTNTSCKKMSVSYFVYIVKNVYKKKKEKKKSTIMYEQSTIHKVFII